MRKPIHPSGAWCSKCFGSHYTNDCPKVTPPKPLESPQEIPLTEGKIDQMWERHEQETMRKDEERMLLRIAEPKPAPQEMMCFQYGCSNTVTLGWHLCDEHKPAPQADGFEDWWKQTHFIVQLHDVLASLKVVAISAWSAAQAPMLQKIAELEEKLRDTKKALELACANDTWTAAVYLMAAKGNDDE